jgi:hypothetical protein
VTREFDPDDPLFRPISVADAMALTNRSKGTIDRWIKQGHLRVVRLKDPPQDALIEREVVDTEHSKRLAAHQGRPRPKRGEGESEGPDESA